jgi:hypothetical protein
MVPKKEGRAIVHLVYGPAQASKLKSKLSEHRRSKCSVVYGLFMAVVPSVGPKTPSQTCKHSYSVESVLRVSLLRTVSDSPLGLTLEY